MSITAVKATLPFSTNGLVWKNNGQCSGTNNINLSGGYLINYDANVACTSVSAERFFMNATYKI